MLKIGKLIPIPTSAPGPSRQVEPLAESLSGADPSLGRRLKQSVKRYLYHRAGMHEPRDAFADMARLLEGEDVRSICDVGANVGDVSQRFSAMFPHARIVSFEPTPTTFAALEARNLPRVTPVQAACGEQSGRLTLNINVHPGANSFLDRPRTGKAYHMDFAQHVSAVDVDVLRLDEAVDACDLLKLDIQGFELQALKGAERLLPGVKLIYSEVQIYPNYAGASRFHELLDWLVQRDFDIFGLYTTYGDKDGQWTFGDAIFISNDLRSKKLDAGKYDPTRYV